MQVKVTGGGNGTPGPLVKFPGAYKNSDAYANFSLYGGYKPFAFPGPTVWSGSGSNTVQSTTTRPASTTTTAASKPQSTAACSTGTATTFAPNLGTQAALYNQCGGSRWTGAKTCAQGRCVVANVWYSQCIL